jgi:hypothetical protein
MVIVIQVPTGLLAEPTEPYNAAILRSMPYAYQDAAYQACHYYALCSDWRPFNNLKHRKRCH